MTEYIIEGYYSDFCGWEEVCREDNLEDATTRLNEYDYHEFNYPHRIRRETS